MKNKFYIVGQKVLIIWPIGILIALAFDTFYQIEWISPLLIGLIISLGRVFWNVFEYDKFNSIEEKDYLESKHKISFPNSPAMLDMIRDQTQGVFANVVLVDKEDEQGFWLFDVANSRSQFTSFMMVNFSSDNIVVTIKPKYFSFLPNRAENYRIIHRLKKRAEKLATTLEPIRDAN